MFLFFTFFPKVASGPIVLWKDFSSQIYNRKVSVDLFFSGMNRVMIGFAKKSIIADSLGTVVQLSLIHILLRVLVVQSVAK